MKNKLIRTIIKPFLITIAVFCFGVCHAQDKAIVVQNFWYNELNDYNPREFFDDIYKLLQQKLSVKNITEEPESFMVQQVDSSNERKIKANIIKRNEADNAYYIAIASELRFPLINIGKLILKSPVRRSKLSFSYHVYNNHGMEVLGDTIISRGCVSRLIEDEKNSKAFYPNFATFLEDMKCHFNEIKQAVQQKTFAKKPALYKET